MNDKKIIEKYKWLDIIPISCRICGIVGTSLAGHIVKIHNISIAEYQKQFNCGLEDISIQDKMLSGVCDDCGKEIYFKTKKSKCCTECKEIQKNLKKQNKIQRKLKQYEEEGITPVVCKICGYPAIDLAGHIGKLHMPVSDYLKQFNGTSKDIRTAEYLKGQSERVSGDKNPGWHHGGKLSVYSRYNPNFDPQKKEAAVQKTKAYKMEHESYTNRIGYWLKQGYDLETAEKLLSERQTTFSLEKCIAKLGPELGLQRWNERQQKWLTSLPKGNFSKVSQKLFWMIMEKIGNTYGDIAFAELNPETNTKDETGENYEAVVQVGDKIYVRPDFYVESLDAIIEFDGEYWHEQRIQENPEILERYEIRDNNLLEAGYFVFHVKERDFYDDELQVVNNCIEFLKNIANEREQSTATAA